ncbi:MAG TPA: hypothetical protein VGJ27_11730 [Gaiellaceae bacterium]
MLIRRRKADAPNCRRRSLLDRVRSLLRFARNDSRCGDWYVEPPPDSFVREPRRPRPSTPSTSVALELPPDLM